MPNDISRHKHVFPHIRELGSKPLLLFQSAVASKHAQSSEGTIYQIHKKSATLKGLLIFNTIQVHICPFSVIRDAHVNVAGLEQPTSIGTEDVVLLQKCLILDVERGRDNI